MAKKIVRPHYRSAKCCATCSRCYVLYDWDYNTYHCQHATAPSKRMHVGRAYQVDPDCVCDAWQKGGAYMTASERASSRGLSASATRRGSALSSFG